MEAEPVRRAETLAAELLRQLGPDMVDVGEAERVWAARDAAGDYRLPGVASLLPVAVVRPSDAPAVIELVRWANRWRVPLVPRGAGTGVMGAARVRGLAVVVDLSGFRHLEVFPEDMVVEAGAGLRLQEVNAALAPHGLMLGHDPWSVSLASVGGAISTDGVGYLAGRFGSMGDQVLGLEAVLPDGTLVRTPAVKPSTGPDLRRLWIGSQGAFGLILRAWLAAVPRPQHELFRTFRFPGFEMGYKALLQLWRTGLRYEVLDLSDGRPEALGVEPGSEDEDGRTALLHLGAFGVEAEEAEVRIRVAERLLTGAGGQSLGPEPAQAYWRERHDLAESYRQEVDAPQDPEARRRWGEEGLDYLNLALPPSRVLPYRRIALARVRSEPGFELAETGIWCRPELFSLLIFEGSGPEPARGRDPERMARLVEDLARTAIRHGGDAEYIHGSGLKFRALLPEELGAGLDLLRRLKRAVDPQELLQADLW